MRVNISILDGTPTKTYECNLFVCSQSYLSQYTHLMRFRVNEKHLMLTYENVLVRAGACIDVQLAYWARAGS